MENHPIPQDVTGFKFKLVGSITLKEFGYILGGAILALIVYFLPQLSILVKLPFMVLFGGIGSALAFVPIEGRPMDNMLYNFIKTVPSENEFIYHKKGIDIRSLEYFKPLKPTQSLAAQTKTHDSLDSSRRDMFYSQLRRSSYKVDDDEMALLQNVKSYFDDSSTQKATIIPTQQPAANMQAQPMSIPTTPHALYAATAVVPPHVPTMAHTENQPPPLKDVSHIPSNKIIANDSLHPLIPVVNAAPIENVTVELGKTPTTPFHVTQDELTQATIKELTATPVAAPMQASGEEFRFRQKPVTQADTIPTPVTPSSNQQTQIRTGFPNLPDKPNIILGIVKDARGRVLPNILVEVLDGNGLSVRAFKTNALGQFASATPLPNGTYSILLNDQSGKQQFQNIPITLDGKIFQPVEIASTDAREKLRQELFGSSPVSGV